MRGGSGPAQLLLCPGSSPTALVRDLRRFELSWTLSPELCPQPPSRAAPATVPALDHHMQEPVVRSARSGNAATAALRRLRGIAALDATDSRTTSIEYQPCTMPTQLKMCRHVPWPIAAQAPGAPGGPTRTSLSATATRRCASVARSQPAADTSGSANHQSRERVVLVMHDEPGHAPIDLTGLDPHLDIEFEPTGDDLAHRWSRCGRLVRPAAGRAWRRRAAPTGASESPRWHRDDAARVATGAGVPSL